MIRVSDYFKAVPPVLENIFSTNKPVWKALDHLEGWLDENLPAGQTILSNNISAGAIIGDRVFIDEGVIIEPGVYIIGPAYISKNAVIRHGAYLRENVFIGENCVVGHATEVKNSILMAGASAAHFNYIGDSILGQNVMLGAGAKLANLSLHSKNDPETGKRKAIRLNINGESIDTNRAKLGAILGDDVQIGCNVVANPGCLILPNTNIYPGSIIKKGLYQS